MHAIFHARRPLAATLCVLLGLLLLLVSCDAGGKIPDESTAPTDGTTAAATEAAATAYSVTLQNGDGTPATDIIVRLTGETEAMKLVDPTGKATFELPAGDYTVTLEAPSGKTFHYDEAAARLTADATDLALLLWPTAAGTQQILAPVKNAAEGEGHAEQNADLIEDGTTFIQLREGAHTYVIFTPARGGRYHFSVSEGLTLSYHGMPILVFDQNLMEPDENGVIEIDVENSSVGGNSLGQLVFRITPTGDTPPAEAFITVERIGDIPRSEIELAEWVVPMADPAALKPYEGDTSGKLTDLDVTNPDITVVLGEDGYYHYGSATGPIVFLRLTSGNRYVADFVKMCETDRLRAYFYKEDGSFDRKESYNGMIAEYAEFANADGVVPMNQQLAAMVQNIGNTMGWWNFEAGTDIFGDTIVSSDIAWLFACAYYLA